LLCERPNQDWAYTLARHWLYDTADDVRLETLEGSSDADVAALVTKIRREERYHLVHADMWLQRIAHGPVEGRNKLIAAVADALPDALGLFEPLENEEKAVSEGWMPVASPDMQRVFAARAATELERSGISVDQHPGLGTAEFVASSSGDLLAGDENGAPNTSDMTGIGGRVGNHSEDFQELWNVMTHTYRTHPGASW
jgi:ring-1,2-phenylacetyl-CoA epoxidase subunit PaaC